MHTEAKVLVKMPVKPKYKYLVCIDPYHVWASSSQRILCAQFMMLLSERGYGAFACTEAVDRGIPGEGGSKPLRVTPGSTPHVQQTPASSPRACVATAPTEGRALEPGLPVTLVCALHILLLAQQTMYGPISK